MSTLSLNFGVLLELTEDWLRNNLSQSRIIAKIVDGEKIVEIPVGGAYYVPNQKTIWLVTKARDQEDIFDDEGNLLNDDSPKGIYRDLAELENQELDYNTPLGIEIWFEDGEDDIQYKLQCHDYSIHHDLLIVQYFLGRDVVEFEAEFRQLLHEQY